MMIYTTYMTEGNGSKYLRNFEAKYGRGDVPVAKFSHTFFDEVPVSDDAIHPLDMADNTTLEAPVLDDRYDPVLEKFVFERITDDVPHHVHLKFNLPVEAVEFLSHNLPYENLLIQQNMAKLPRNRLIATVILPDDAMEVIHRAQKLPGYAGAVADLLLADNLR